MPPPSGPNTFIFPDPAPRREIVRLEPEIVFAIRRVDPEIVWMLAVVTFEVVMFAVVIATVPRVARPTTTRVPLALRFWNTVDIF